MLQDNLQSYFSICFNIDCFVIIVLKERWSGASTELKQRLIASMKRLITAIHYYD